MGVIIIGPDGEEIENTFKKKKEEPKTNDRRHEPHPELEIVRIPEPKKQPYIPLRIPQPSEGPLIDEDFGVAIPYKKLPEC